MCIGPNTSGKKRIILSPFPALGREMYVCRSATVIIVPCGTPSCAKAVGLQHASPGGDARIAAIVLSRVSHLAREINRVSFVALNLYISAACRPVCHNY